MAKQIYEVRGTYAITVLKRVKAKDEQEAIELAERYFSGITEYCGNGGYDKLVGVEEDSESVSADGCVEWQDAYETDDDRYDEETDNEFCTYTCKLCGEVFECENEDVFENMVEDAIYEHLEADHGIDCSNMLTHELVNEYFEREEC